MNIENEQSEQHDNRELQLAWDFVEHTGRSIFLTGKAGTGKTTFLKKVVAESAKRPVVVAPTGVAAINAGGVTIHSFFQLPLSPFVPNAKVKSRFDFGREKRKIIASMDLLIIDEISMVRADLLDAIDSVLRRFRDRYQPFGGVQLLMIGDLGQLTPVVTPEDEQILRPYYDTPYFFGSKALSETEYVTIQLEQVYRQQDQSFVEILNHVRIGKLTSDDLQRLNSRSIAKGNTTSAIRLTTHNYAADRYNESQLSKLSSPAFTYQATVKGTFPDYSYPTAVDMTLKVGTQVMFIKNDPEGRYYNGRIGHVILTERNRVQIYCEGDDEAIEVEPQIWENAKYTLDSETRELKTEIQGTFTQLPLRLAWAITIHKSQGLTFDHAIIDANQSFAPGQVYVALSRCRTLEGLQLASPINPRAIISDQRVDSYISQQDAATSQSIQQLLTLKDEYYRRLMLELFDFTSIQYKEEHLSRLFIEYFYNAFNQITDLHKQTVQAFKRDITDVALKWRMAIGLMSIAQLNEGAFQERLKRSCDYFYDKLNEILSRPISLSKPVKTNNKEAMKRLDDAVPELTQAYLARKFLLRRISENGFSASAYLKHKQQALISAMDMQDNSDPSRQRKKKKATNAEKPKKDNTRVVTYRMFLQGVQPDEIARERGLTLVTIINHLMGYVETGELEMDDLIEKHKRKAIKLAIAKVGSFNNVKAIMALCPPDVTYSDIIIVIKETRQK
ncbi:MAG: helix-turn-helix domain-containing protein [Prevotella sp.]|nr:helix-turn-helix domain-containing protein [Prevotella sp.]